MPTRPSTQNDKKSPCFYLFWTFCEHNLFFNSFPSFFRLPNLNLTHIPLQKSLFETTNADNLVPKEASGPQSERSGSALTVLSNWVSGCFAWNGPHGWKVSHFFGYFWFKFWRYSPGGDSLGPLETKEMRNLGLDGGSSPQASKGCPLRAYPLCNHIRLVCALPKWPPRRPSFNFFDTT